MRLHEFVNLKEDASVAATSSGSVATVAAPLGQVIKRNPDSLFLGKYTDDSTPNTPAEYKKYKRKK